MAVTSGHPSSCATATLGSVCHCECGGVRHSWAGGDMPSGVKGPLSGLSGTKPDAVPSIPNPGTPADVAPVDVPTPDAPDTSNAPSAEPPTTDTAPANERPDLAELVNSPVTGRQSLTPGLMGVVERVSHEGGDEFHKINRPPKRAGRGRPAEVATDAEELAGLVGEALRTSIPRVYRAGPAELHTDWTDGQTGAEYELDHADEMNALIRSDEGRRIGLFDLITNNADRHSGNYMVTEDGRIVGIDHGLAWGRVDTNRFADDATDEEVLRFGLDHTTVVGTNPFLADFDNWGSGIGFISRDELIEMRIRLAELRPTFRARGHENWLDHSLRVLDALAPRVRG